MGTNVGKQELGKSTLLPSVITLSKEVPQRLEGCRIIPETTPPCGISTIGIETHSRLILKIY
jgi:hypothetical protein